ncbi:MAG: periplasmic heavy metal sensor [Chitinophagaceae bacterium]
MRKVLNNKVLLFIVAILLLANIAMLFYFLWMREPERKNTRGDRQKSPMTEFLQVEIGFNTEQLAAFEKTRQQHRQKMKPLFEDIKTAKVQFYGFLTDPSINDSTINAAALQIGEKQKLLDMQTFHNFREIRSLCTPEQQPRYDSLIVNEISKMWFPSWKGSGRQEKNSPKPKH